ncbi:MAG: hypothetical protein M1468_02975, partial [Candidatus Thermoplasmatota archaeon]|nr:hypothetical protein [Candidatus Thermoplasmatota archaeon]
MADIEVFCISPFFFKENLSKTSMILSPGSDKNNDDHDQSQEISSPSGWRGIAAPFYTLDFNGHLVIKTLQIKLLPDDDQKQAIIDTFTKFNEACNFVSRTA